MSSWITVVGNMVSIFVNLQHGCRLLYLIIDVPLPIIKLCIVSRYAKLSISRNRNVNLYVDKLISLLLCILLHTHRYRCTCTAPCLYDKIMIRNKCAIRDHDRDAGWRRCAMHDAYVGLDPRCNITIVNNQT